jgi:polyferredoxin
MTLNFRKLIQFSFLVAFAILLVFNKATMWMIIFLTGIIAAFFFGRFYCGWICPINTLMEITGWVSKKLNFQQKNVLGWIKKSFVRYGLLGVFIGLMLFTIVSGKKMPILVIMIGAGTVITLFFKPSLWHRYLCPYGTILSVPGLLAKYKFQINKDTCIKCGVCKAVCPAEAVEMKNKKEFPQIIKSSCIQCSKCADKCPKQCIQYGKEKHHTPNNISI